MSTIEEIQERSKTLPEPLAKEVLEFLLFVSRRQLSSETKQLPSYRSLKGAWRGRLSSSENFAIAKAQEIEREG